MQARNFSLHTVLPSGKEERQSRHNLQNGAIFSRSLSKWAILRCCMVDENQASRRLLVFKSARTLSISSSVYISTARHGAVPVYGRVSPETAAWKTLVIITVFLSNLTGPRKQLSNFDEVDPLLPIRSKIRELLLSSLEACNTHSHSG